VRASLFLFIIRYPGPQLSDSDSDSASVSVSISDSDSDSKNALLSQESSYSTNITPTETKR